MGKNKDKLTPKDIVRNQFLEFHALQQKIEIINIVNSYHEKQNIIGNKSQKIRFDRYIETFDNMMYNDEYTIVLEDDSLICMEYVFDDYENIVEHNLSYLPGFRQSPKNNIEKLINESFYGQRFEEEVYDDHENIVEHNSEDEFAGDENNQLTLLQLQSQICNYIRIDFDEQGRKEYYHSLIHMHVGTNKNSIRIPVEHSILPFEFLYFILKYLYFLSDNSTDILICDIPRQSMLTDKEKKRLKLVFADCIN